MKHLRKFENFGQDLGRFGQESSENPYVFSSEETQETDPFYTEKEKESEEEEEFRREEEKEECETCGEESEMPTARVWGDEATYVEKFQSFFEKKKEKSESYEKSGLEKPKLADRNKNKKIEPWEKAVAKKIEKSMDKKGNKEDKKDNKKEEKGGVSDKQKEKLSPALQKAILAKKNK
jgi:hypothetical protein